MGPTYAQNIWHNKVNNKKKKRPPIDSEKIFANDVTNKGLVSKIYKLLMTLNSIKKNNPVKKMGQRPKQTFLQRRHTDGQEAHEEIFNIASY